MTVPSQNLHHSIDSTKSDRHSKSQDHVRTLTTRQYLQSHAKKDKKSLILSLKSSFHKRKSNPEVQIQQEIDKNIISRPYSSPDASRETSTSSNVSLKHTPSVYYAVCDSTNARSLLREMKHQIVHDTRRHTFPDTKKKESTDRKKRHKMKLSDRKQKQKPLESEGSINKYTKYRLRDLGGFQWKPIIPERRRSNSDMTEENSQIHLQHASDMIPLYTSIDEPEEWLRSSSIRRRHGERHRQSQLSILSESTIENPRIAALNCAKQWLMTISTRYDQLKRSGLIDNDENNHQLQRERSATDTVYHSDTPAKWLDQEYIAKVRSQRRHTTGLLSNSSSFNGNKSSSSVKHVKYDDIPHYIPFPEEEEEVKDDKNDKNDKKKKFVWAKEEITRDLKQDEQLQVEYIDEEDTDSIALQERVE